MNISKVHLADYLKQGIKDATLHELIPSILDNFSLLELNKNAFFVEEGQICKHFCYIETGVLQHAIRVSDEEKTTYLALKNSLTSALNSFKNQVPSRKSIRALSDCKTLGY